MHWRRHRRHAAERARELGGELKLSNLDPGTLLELQIPYSSLSREPSEIIKRMYFNLRFSLLNPFHLEPAPYLVSNPDRPTAGTVRTRFKYITALSRLH